MLKNYQNIYLFFLSCGVMAGFAVTGHVDGAGKSHVFVSDVDPLGLSARGGKTMLRFSSRGRPSPCCDSCSEFNLHNYMF